MNIDLFSRARETQARAEPGVREIEQIFDHRLHALARVPHALERSLLPFIGAGFREQLHTIEQRGERIA